MVFGAAFRAFALDETVGQEKLFDRVVILFDGPRFNQPGGAQFEVNIVGAVAGFVRMRRVVIVEADVKAREVARMLAMHALDQGFRRNAFFFRPQHDRRAVRVVGANVPAFVAGHFLIAYPDIGLNIFNQMAKVNGAIGVRQG
ncbi:MAG: hypothetical protein ACD_10C00798G0002 [uncultured bacterium]|nr:MAG: hypothetical protein ACD_10C00798G0002 [uncultured bacterium]